MYIPLRLVHSRRGRGCLYSCTLMIWNMWSYEPAVIMLALSWEESQGDVPTILSGKGFLARTTNLPTHWGKRTGKLDSIENRDIVQRVAELEAGAGIEDPNLWLHQCHCVSIKLQHQLQLGSGLAQTAGWRHFSFGWSVMLMPAGDGWGRKNSVSFIVKTVFWTCLKALLWSKADSQSKFSRTVDRTKIN